MSNKNREIINPDTVFNVEGFTHAVVAKGDKTVYLSGQLAWDKDFQIIGAGDLVKQTKQVLQNIEHILDELGATWDHVVKTTIYTTEPEKNELIAQVKHEFLKGIPSPAETLIGVDALAMPEFLIEIEAIVVM